MLSGRDPYEFTANDGGLALLKQKLLNENEAMPADDASITAAVATALSMGWILLEPFVLYATNFKGDVSKARARVQEEIQAILKSGLQR